MKDRLIELLDIIIQPGEKTLGDIADHLIANGVIVPPCKVGDTIYRCGDITKKVYEWEIIQVQVYFHEIVFIDDSDNYFTEADIGKTVFLTKEEAEAALQKGGADK